MPFWQVLRSVQQTVPIGMLMLAIIVLEGLLASCTQPENQRVDLDQRHPLNTLTTVTHKPELRIGMGAMITPKEGYFYYNRLKDYLAKRLDMTVTLVDRESYAEINKLLAEGGLDIAFVCSGPYVEGREQFDLELLVMPLVNGKPLYHSYIIVPQDSPARDLADLRGKRFAFTDPKSNSGKLVPTCMLAQQGFSPERFFSSHSYTYGHDKSIFAVAARMVDGAAVDSLIWEYLNRTQPDLTSRTRILHVSEPYGIPPLVNRRGLDHKLRERIQTALLSMHQTPEGHAILAGMMIDRFVPGDDSNYDSIRALRRKIDGKTTKMKSSGSINGSLDN